MDVKPIISCHPSGFKETPHSFLKELFNGKSGELISNVKQDALEAVKLDPAVLEAQVTVHADKAINATNLNRIRDDVIENQKVEDPVTSASVPITTTTPAQTLSCFEDMVKQQEAALLSLTPHQLELLMKYVDVLRRQRMITQKYLECAFCKNNGKPSYWYTSHALRDTRGRVQCPILRRFRCLRCGATGDHAHTIKYCPDNSLIDTRSSCSGSSSH